MIWDPDTGVSPQAALGSVAFATRSTFCPTVGRESGLVVPKTKVEIEFTTGALDPQALALMARNDAVWLGSLEMPVDAVAARCTE